MFHDESVVVRRLPLPRSRAFQALRELCAAHLKCADASIAYLDCDRDVVCVESEAELAESLRCASADELGAQELLDGVHEMVEAVPHYGIGYGLLRYLYAPTARAFASIRPADIAFTYAGTIPDMSAFASDEAPVQFDTDAESPVRESIPGLGHAVELRVYRSRGQLRVDWWYDARRIDGSAAQALADRFGSELTGLVAEAAIEEELDSANEELTLVEFD